MLTGFGNKAQESTIAENQVENAEVLEESPIKNGKYEIDHIKKDLPGI